MLYSFGTGDFSYTLVYMCAFCGCIVALYAVAAYLASAAMAKVPDKDENRELRRRLRSLRKGAVMNCAPNAFACLCGSAVSWLSSTGIVESFLQHGI